METRLNSIRINTVFKQKLVTTIFVLDLPSLVWLEYPSRIPLIDHKSISRIAVRFVFRLPLQVLFSWSQASACNNTTICFTTYHLARLRLINTNLLWSGNHLDSILSVQVVITEAAYPTYERYRVTKDPHT